MTAPIITKIMTSGFKAPDHPYWVLVESRYLVDFKDVIQEAKREALESAKIPKGEMLPYDGDLVAFGDGVFRVHAHINGLLKKLNKDSEDDPS